MPSQRQMEISRSRTSCSNSLSASQQTVLPPVWLTSPARRLSQSPRRFPFRGRQHPLETRARQVLHLRSRPLPRGAGHLWLIPFLKGRRHTSGSPAWS